MHVPGVQTLSLLLTALFLVSACGSEEKPPDIPDDVVAAYDQALKACTTAVETANPILSEAQSLLKKHQDEINAALKVSTEWPFTFRFDDKRHITLLNEFNAYQLYVTMPSGVASEGYFIAKTDPYFPALAPRSPLITGVKRFYLATVVTYLAPSRDPSNPLQETDVVGRSATCEGGGGVVGYSAYFPESVFFGETKGQELPTVRFRTSEEPDKASLCRQNGCVHVEGKNVTWFAGLDGRIETGTGPQLGIWRIDVQAREE